MGDVVVRIQVDGMAGSLVWDWQHGSCCREYRMLVSVMGARDAV